MVNFDKLNDAERKTFLEARTVFDSIYVDLLEGLGKTVIRKALDSKQASMIGEAKSWYQLPLRQVYLSRSKHMVAAVNVSQSEVGEIVDEEQARDYILGLAVAAGIFFGSKDFEKNVDLAVAVLLKHYRLQLASVNVEEVILSSQATRDVLTVLGGATVVNDVVVRDIYGRHYNDGLATNGMLYTGTIAQQKIANPNLLWEWSHITPAGRALEEHSRLDGLKYSQKDRESKLANSSVSWLGTFFFPGDHKGCQCFEMIIGVK